MARLIDEEGVLRDKVWFCGGFVSDDFSMGYMEALDKVETVIRQAPAVDAVPVVHGRWIDEYPYVRCSVCNAEWLNCRTDNEPKLFYYCPNCGAKMDLEEEE